LPWNNGASTSIDPFSNLPFLLIIPTDHVTFICFLPHKLLQLSRGLLKEYVPWWATDGSARPIERLSPVDKEDVKQSLEDKDSPNLLRPPLAL